MATMDPERFNEQMELCRAEYVKSDGGRTWNEWVQEWFSVDVFRARDFIREWRR